MQMKTEQNMYFIEDKLKILYLLYRIFFHDFLLFIIFSFQWNVDRF